jgi:GT2 family glycosyltransferase
MPVEYARGAALMMRRFFFTAIRQIDERYGQFGSDADLCFQIRRAGKKILLLPQARARHEGRSEESALRKADRQQGTAAFAGKYGGFWSGLRTQIAAIFGALGSLQLTVLKYLVASQKVDGSQQE